MEGIVFDLDGWFWREFVIEIGVEVATPQSQEFLIQSHIHGEIMVLVVRSTINSTFLNKRPDCRMMARILARKAETAVNSAKTSNNFDTVQAFRNALTGIVPYVHKHCTHGGKNIVHTYLDKNTPKDVVDLVEKVLTWEMRSVLRISCRRTVAIG